MPIQRHIKNVVNNYTETQRKVRDATCSDPWGPSSTLMAEIAEKTYNFVTFGEIMEIILRRLNDKKSKNWLHVYKSLILLEYLVKTGHESVAIQCREHIHIIETLKLFEHYDNGQDHGLKVRMKAQALSELLRDEERLNEERAKALLMRDRLMQSGLGGMNSSLPAMSRTGSLSPRNQIPLLETIYLSKSTPSRSPNVSSDLDSLRPKSIGEEQLQIQFALAASKEEHDREEQRRRSEEAKDEAKLQLALEQSRKEEQQAANAARPLISTSIPNVAAVPAVQNYFDDLLDIPTSAPAPVTFNDPWSTQPSQPANDPFAQGLSSSSNNPIPIDDPWSTPVQTEKSHTTSPFGSSFVDNSAAFGQPSAPQFWAATSVSPVPASMPPFNVPSSGPHSANNGAVSEPNSTNQNAVENSSGKDDAAPRKRTPADFLGEHQGLVDLDKLIETNPVSTNPFAVSLRPDKGSTSANPFLVNQTVKPSLNQLAPAFRPTLWNQPHPVPNFGVLPASNAFGPSSNAFMPQMQSNPWGIPANAMAQQRPTSSNPFY